MTDNLTLADLRVVAHRVQWRNLDGTPDGESTVGTRPATREDILTVLRELGGVEFLVERLEFDQPKLVVGRYLIVPIEEWCISHGQAESDPSHPRDKDCRYG